jgi:hypothetical protein
MNLCRERRHGNPFCGALALLAAIWLLGLVLVGSAQAATWFSPTSFWNRELPADAAVSPNSGAYVNELVRQVDATVPWINTTEYSTPVYTVGPKQPKVKVLVRPENGTYVEPSVKAAFHAVPLPGKARPAAGADGHLVLWQPSTERMWEFWQLRREGGGWVVSRGGAIGKVRHNPGYITSSSWKGATRNWGATGSGLPLAGGLITIEQWESGDIGHALAIGIPEPGPTFVWPARRSDGWRHTSEAIPEGTIFRLPASLSVQSLNLPRAGQLIAEAAQKYGIVVRDVSGSVSFYGEDPTNGTEPYAGLFKGLEPREILARFPWGELQALAPAH